MKLVFISDTHTYHHDLTNDLLPWVEDGNNILIHSGDLTFRGRPHEITNFLNWFGDQKFKHKIFIAGNHDWGFVYNHDIAPEFKEKGIIYLYDSMVEVEGLRIYGSPWQPYFHNWAFNLRRGEELAEVWKKIPEGLDVLITHGPVFGILDLTYNGERVGCDDLYSRVFEVNPKIHVCGHIHSSYGYREFGGTLFLNASSLNEGYVYANKPIVVTLDDEKKIIDITN